MNDGNDQGSFVNNDYSQNGYNQGNQNDYNAGGYNQNGYGQNNYNQNGGYNYDPSGATPNQVPEGAGQGFAIGSLVCGILSIVMCCCYGIPGIVLGIVAIILRNKSKALDGGVPSTMATAGMVCGIIGIVFGVLTFIYIIFSMLVYSRTDPQELYKQIQEMIGEDV